MALQQHLGDACRAAEIAVDLKGRMGTEEVGIGACLSAPVEPYCGLQQVSQQSIGVVAVTEAGPEADFPCHRPAGAAIAPAE